VRCSGDVVGERDHHDEQDEGEPDDRNPLVDFAREGAAADRFDQREEDVAAVEGQQRQEIQQRQRHAHEGEDLEVVRPADSQLFLRDLDDPYRPRELAAPLAREQPRESMGGAGHDAPELRSSRARCSPRRVWDGLRRRLEAEDPAAVFLDRVTWADSHPLPVP